MTNEYIFERFKDGIKTVARWSEMPDHVIDVLDGKDYKLFTDEDGYWYYIKHFVKHYVMWG